MKTQNINIASLLSESNLSAKNKLNISHKLNNLINIIEEVRTKKNISNIELDEILLSKEIKSTAKVIVKRSDQFQKKIIESTLKKKEETLEMLEISKLRVEAQIKDLEKRKTALTVKTNNSFFYNLKRNLFKLFNITTIKKSFEKPLSLEDKLKNYNLKLSNYELEKDKMSKSFSETGSQKLALLRKQTYYALSSSKIIATQEAIQSIKEKINNL